MDRYWPVDFAGCTAPGRMIALLALLSIQAFAADHYERGMELARAERWAEAREELLAGSMEAPTDKRFPLELAGVEYRLGDFLSAKKYLKNALRLSSNDDPDDAYANDFLGTLYFLDGNYESALVRWNKVGKPRISEIEIPPSSPISPVLLDRALAFAPGDTLSTDRYLSTLAWLKALDAFDNFRLDLAAEEEQNFGARLEWRELPDWVRVASALGGVPFGIAEVKWPNLNERAMTGAAMYRWDAQKRRAFLSIASPLAGNPKTRYTIFGDARGETWNLGQPTDFRVRKIEGGVQLRMIPSGRFSWETGVNVAARAFPGSPFASGYGVKHLTAVNYRLLSVPDHRLTVDAKATWETGRVFASAASGLYARTQGSVTGRWLPKPRGFDHETVARVGFGTAFGSAPLDELFMLTLDRDYDLPLRGHRGLVDGKRGSAPIGRRYVLANFEFHKELWRGPFVTIDAGPVVDAGTVWQALSGPSGKLLVDAGAQVRLRLPAGFTFILSYARDLRSGTGNFDSFTQ